MMRSVALMDQSYQHDDDFIIIEPSRPEELRDILPDLGSEECDGDYDDGNTEASYDYCDDAYYAEINSDKLMSHALHRLEEDNEYDDENVLSLSLSTSFKWFDGENFSPSYGLEERISSLTNQLGTLFSVEKPEVPNDNEESLCARQESEYGGEILGTETDVGGVVYETEACGSQHFSSTSSTVVAVAELPVTEILTSANIGSNSSLSSEIVIQDFNIQSTCIDNKNARSRHTSKRQRKQMKLSKKTAAAAAALAHLSTNLHHQPNTSSTLPSLHHESRPNRKLTSTRNSRKQVANIAVCSATKSIADYKSSINSHQRKKPKSSRASGVAGLR